MEPLKGLMQQINEHYEANKNKPPLTKEEFVKLVRDAAKKDVQHRINEVKSRKENFKHLEKRSKELGKPIPPELLIRCAMEGKPIVGSDFIEKYKEWIN